MLHKFATGDSLENAEKTSILQHETMLKLNSNSHHSTFVDDAKSKDMTAKERVNLFVDKLLAIDEMKVASSAASKKSDFFKELQVFANKWKSTIHDAAGTESLSVRNPDMLENGVGSYTDLSDAMLIEVQNIDRGSGGHSLLDALPKTDGYILQLICIKHCQTIRKTKVGILSAKDLDKIKDLENHIREYHRITTFAGSVSLEGEFRKGMIKILLLYFTKKSKPLNNTCKLHFLLACNTF